MLVRTKVPPDGAGGWVRPEWSPERMTTEERNDERSTDEEIELDPPTGADHEEVREAVERVESNSDSDDIAPSIARAVLRRVVR